MKRFLFIFLYVLINTKTLLGYPFWDEKTHRLYDRTFSEIHYDTISDATFLKKLVTQPDDASLKKLYEALQSLCFRLNGSWRDFLENLQCMLTKNPKTTILSQPIPINGQLKAVLIPFLLKNKDKSSASHISVVTAIWLYIIPYCSDEELKQLASGNLSLLREKFDDYACSFIEKNTLFPH